MLTVVYHTHLGRITTDDKLGGFCAEAYCDVPWRETASGFETLEAAVAWIKKRVELMGVRDYDLPTTWNIGI